MRQRPYITHRAENIYYLALYKKDLLIPDDEPYNIKPNTKTCCRRTYTGCLLYRLGKHAK
jgi:hypothetical protein